MFKLTLIKGLSYSGGREGRVSVTTKKPDVIVETQDEADELVDTGYFKLVESDTAAAKASSGSDGSEGDPGAASGADMTDEEKAAAELDAELKAIDKMTKEELIAYAEKNSVDLSACTNNDQRKEALKAAAKASIDQLTVNFN